MAQNWGDYRDLIGGRLKGWLSNFQNRLDEYCDALANDIHIKELEKWNIPANIINELLIPATPHDQQTFVFRDDLKNIDDIEFDKFNPKTGEVLGKQKLADFSFWGKGKEKGALKVRYESINKCTINLCKFIRNNCDFEKIFPKYFQENFENLEKLQRPLLSKLRETTLGITNDSNTSHEEKLGKMLDVYREFLRPAHEFLAKWNNEGIPESFEDEDGNEFKIKMIKPFKKFDSQTTASTGELEISEELLESKSKNKTKKNSEENGGEKSENPDKKIIGYWSRSFVPSELDRYPRFIGVAQKNPLGEIKNARDSLFLMTSESLQLVRKIREINTTFSSEKWLKGKKNTNHGLFQKNLESLKDLAERYGDRENKHKEKLFEKSQSYKFFTQFIDLENTKSEEQKNNWSEKKLTSIKFFVTGYEYRNNQFLATKPEDFSGYLEKFEKHFELHTVTSAKDVENWLGFQNDNISWFTNERGEILKIYLSLLLRDLGKKIKLPNSTQNFEALKKTTLASLLFDENGNLKSEDLDAAIVRRFFASSIGSEIRSKISILSRKDFIKRNVIQITNGGQSLLRYIPKEYGFETIDHIDAQEKLAIKRTKKRIRKRELEKYLRDECKFENWEIFKQIWKILVNENKPSKNVSASELETFFKKQDSTKILVGK